MRNRFFMGAPASAILALAACATAACGGSTGGGSGNAGVASAPSVAQSGVLREPATSVSQTAIAAAVAANNAFAVDLFGRLRASAPAGNELTSPITASLALTMTYAGAAGTTATQMASALHFGASAASIIDGQNALSQALARARATPSPPTSRMRAALAGPRPRPTTTRSRSSTPCGGSRRTRGRRRSSTSSRGATGRASTSKTSSARPTPPGWRSTHG